MLRNNRKESLNSNSYQNNSTLFELNEPKKQPLMLYKRRILKQENSNDSWRHNTAKITTNYLKSESQKFRSDLPISPERIYLNGPGPGKYARGSSIGCVNHDPTLKMEPAFSMCKASRFAESRSDYFASNSSYNWDRPGTYSRNNFAFRTPGPADYFRASSIGSLHHDPTTPQNPAFSIGRAERLLDLTDSNPFCLRPKSSKLPGPGPLDYSYEKHSNPFKLNSPSFTIPKAPRFPQIIA